MWVIFALLSAASAALVAIFGKIGIKQVDSTTATTIRAGVMFLVMFLLSAALHKLPTFASLHGRVFFWIVLSGLAGAVSWFFYFLALQTGPAGGVTALDRLSVVFTIGLAAIFLGEELTIPHAIGTVLVVAGAVLITR